MIGEQNSVRPEVGCSTIDSVKDSCFVIWKTPAVITRRTRVFNWRDNWDSASFS